MDAGRAGVTRMLPDLRFLIGAVLATALLGVTLFGLAAAMHISQQSKISPIEASRMLAYTPGGQHRIFDVPARRTDSPFLNIPAGPNPVPLQQPAAPSMPPAQTAAAALPAPKAVPTATAQPAPAAELNAKPTPAAQAANLPTPADNHDTVDERAVVDPPLQLDGEPPVETTPAAPAPIAERPVETPESPHVGSIPSTDSAGRPNDANAGETDVAEPVKAKRKRTARKTRTTRPVPRAPVQVDAFGNPTGATSTVNRPAPGFWGPFN